MERTKALIPNNINAFSNFVNTRQTSNAIPQTDTSMVSHSTVASYIVNSLVDHFESVFNSGVASSPICSYFSATEVSQLSINISAVLSGINSLDVIKGTEDDGLPSALYKSCNCIISRPLWIIFNRSLK